MQTRSLNEPPKPRMEASRPLLSARESLAYVTALRQSVEPKRHRKGNAGGANDNRQCVRARNPAVKDAALS